jgi:leucine dehydrogenase
MTKASVIAPAPSTGSPALPTGDDIFEHIAALGVRELHFTHDTATDLHAIIAIHSTRLGPALGGARCLPYPSTLEATLDAMRLARAMSYKAAMAGLPCGGGKAVLMRPPVIRDRDAYFETFGEFVNNLGGRFITAEDSGTAVEDMDRIARRTRYVAGTSRLQGGRGDPSPWTALGVRRGIEAAVRHKLGRDSLKGVHVAIQGTGHVGYFLVRELLRAGARVTVCDMNAEAVQRAEKIGARVVAPDHLLDVACDVFAPCALGGALNTQTIPRLRATIVAGGANNQLAVASDAEALARRDILYAPDYVINAGGLVSSVLRDDQSVERKVLAIHDTLTEIFERAARSGETPAQVADRMAEDTLYDRAP